MASAAAAAPGLNPLGKPRRTKPYTKEQKKKRVKILKPKAKPDKPLAAEGKTQTTDGLHKGRRRKRNYKSLKRFINRIAHGEDLAKEGFRSEGENHHSVSNALLSDLDSCAKDFIQRIGSRAHEIMSGQGRRTLQSRHIMAAARLLLPLGDIATNIMGNAEIYEKRYKASLLQRPNERLRATERAGLTLPVARIRKMMRTYGYGPRIGDTSAVLMTAFIQELIYNLLWASLQALMISNENRKMPRAGQKAHPHTRLSPRWLVRGVAGVAELRNLLADCVISGGGVAPHLLGYLVPQRLKGSRRILKSGVEGDLNRKEYKRKEKRQKQSQGQST